MSVSSFAGRNEYVVCVRVSAPAVCRVHFADVHRAVLECTRAVVGEGQFRAARFRCNKFTVRACDVQNLVSGQKRVTTTFLLDVSACPIQAPSKYFQIRSRPLNFSIHARTLRSWRAYVSFANFRRRTCTGQFKFFVRRRFRYVINVYAFLDFSANG